MICPFCNSSDIANIQGQFYCINCGKQIDAAAVKPKEQAPNAEVAKIAAAMQTEVEKTLKEVQKPTEPEPIAAPPAEGAAPKETDAPPTQIINHSKGKEATAPKMVATDIKPPAKAVKSTPKVEEKIKEPATPEDPPKENPKKHHRKKLRSKKPVMLITTPPKPATPQQKPTADMVISAKKIASKPKPVTSANVVAIPAIATAFLTSLPVAVLQLKTSPIEFSNFLSNWNPGAIANSLGYTLTNLLVVSGIGIILILVYRLYVIGIIIYASSSKLDGSLGTPHEWRRASLKVLGKLIGLELITKVLKAGLLAGLVSLGSFALRSSTKPSLALIGVLVVVNFVALLSLFSALAVKHLARVKLVLSGGSVVQALVGSWQSYKLDAAEIFIRWLCMLALEALIWAPYVYLILRPGQFAITLNSVTGPVIIFVIGCISGTLSLLTSNRFWVGRYRALTKS